MIEHLIINAVFIIGLGIISSDGYVLHWYRRLCENVPFLHKPLITCPICMSSIYGLLYLIIILDVPLFEWKKVPVYLISLAGTVAVTKGIIDIIFLIRDYFQLKRDMLQSILYNSNTDDNH